MHSYIEKVFAFIVAIGVAAVFSPSVSAANIGTADQFVASVAGDPTGTHTLTADIELSGWSPCAFAGTLDGAGHKITGLTGALFSNLTGTVKDLTIQGSATEIAIAPDADFGVLAVVASGATVSGCTVSGFKLISQQVTAKVYPGMGFFVGRAYDGCSFNACSVDSSCSVSVGTDVLCGGIAGAVCRSVEFAAVELAIFTECVNRANCTSAAADTAAPDCGAFGGVLGSFTNTKGKESTVQLRQCKNFGGMTVSESAINHTFGGIVGKYEGNTATTGDNTLSIVSCSNSGNGVNCSISGGMLGFGGSFCPKFLIDMCVNDGSVSSKVSAGCYGGLVGYCLKPARNNTSTIRNSISRGSITVDGSCNGASGAIGYMEFTTTTLGSNVKLFIQNCSFEGEITGDKVALIVVSGTKARTGTEITADNCWVSKDAPRFVCSDSTGITFTEPNLQIHVSGKDAAECTALNGVASGVDEYLAWAVNATTGHPEPELPFTVRFIDWDGALLKQQLVSPGEAATAPADPSRTGYTFGGWSPSEFDNVTSDMTIIACYDCTVVFNNWDGSRFTSVSVREGGVVTKPSTNPVRENHTFQYWALGGAEYDFTAPVTAALTLTAEFTINKYPVKFFDWKGDQIGETQYVPHGGAAVAPTRPLDPEGMYFKRWSCDFSNVTSPLDVSMVMSSIASVVWVSASGLDTDGRGTMAAPYKTVKFALNRLDPDDGGTVCVMTGLYEWTSPLVVSAPIRVCGAGDGEVVFRNTNAASASDADHRVVKLSHKDAVLAGVSIENGSCCLPSDNNSGGGVLITAGMVSNCVIRGCLDWKEGDSLPFGGGVSVCGSDAVLTHSVVTNCGTYVDDASGAACGGAVYVNNGGVVQNTIVADCFIGKTVARTRSAAKERIVGGIFAGNGVARNCTVVGCFGSHTGGVYANADGIVVNCAIIGCRKIRSGVDEVSAWNGTAAAFSNCAADADPVSGMTACLGGLTEDDFNGFNDGDFVPAKISLLVNHGKRIPEFAKATDFYGRNRVVKVIDIGCGESQFVPGLVITGKRID